MQRAQRFDRFGVLVEIAVDIGNPRGLQLFDGLIYARPVFDQDRNWRREKKLALAQIDIRETVGNGIHGCRH
jgi:hypothetical protein